MTGSLSAEQLGNLARYGATPAGMNSYGFKGGLDHFSQVSEHPLSSSSATAGSFQRRTAWRTREPGHGPMSYTANTRGSTINFDNPMSTPRVES